MQELSPLLPTVGAVWLLHADLNLAHFSFRKLTKIASCAFWPAAAPLVAHPLLRDPAGQAADSADVYPPPAPAYLHGETWRGERDWLAARTDWLPLGVAPLIRADFLAWLVAGLLKPLAGSMGALGSDGGVDSVLCAAARVYADKVAAQSPPSASAQSLPGPVPCAIVLGGSQVTVPRPTDLAAHRPGQLSSRDRRALDRSMANIVRASLPSLVTDATSAQTDPFRNASTYLRSSRLSHQCLES